MADKEQTGTDDITKTEQNTDTTNEIAEDYDFIEINKVIELDANDNSDQEPSDTVNHADADMDAFVQHVRLDTQILKSKAAVANQRRRKPPTRQSAQNRLTLPPQANEFSDIAEFLDGNFEKSRKEIMMNEGEGCQMREKKGIDYDCPRRNNSTKRYTMPPIQPRNFGLTNSYLVQSRQKLAQNKENEDTEILRKSRLGNQDESKTRTSEPVSPPKPALRNLTNRANLKPNEPSPEMRNPTPEFLQHAQRVRKSWVDQSGLRIERLMTEPRLKYDHANKRHSIAVTKGAAELQIRPKVMPKPRSPKKTDSGLIYTENVKPIIPTAPKIKEAQVGEAEKSKVRLSFKVECQPVKTEIENESPKEAKDIEIRVKVNSEQNSPLSPKPRIKPTTPTKPSVTLQKPKVLPSKPAVLSPERKPIPSSRTTIPPMTSSQKSEENEQVVEETDSPERKVDNEAESITTEPSKQANPRPPIALKPKSLQRGKSNTEMSKISITTKYGNNKPLENQINDEEKAKSNRKSMIINLKSEKSIEDDDSEFRDKTSNKIGTATDNKTYKNESKSTENSKQSISPQQKNYNSPITPNNSTPTAERSPIQKEKPIFAFLKAKETTNQQSCYKGSDLNGSFISSGLGTSAKVFINSKDSMQEFANSKSIIPQQKIITY
ncbi:hypothetical protein LOD99_8669 [Oopsacas minuta]|uniref:Uncharacterized protein n=1 Tax=Oopsacas minuta TaxID=111878 RepID=A0AAV7JFE7_9METZ|nr:hypothetical protein LOD99_8669 [Oopsacas minuta]